MLILDKVAEDKEFREKDRLKLGSQQKEVEAASGKNICLVNICVYC